MDKKKAIKLAIEALEYQAYETYEGDELDDPDIAKWIKEKETVIEVLREL